MKLITEAFESLMADYPLYSQEDPDDPLVVAKFFNPVGSGTWLITEYCPKQRLAFGYVMGLGNDELGYMSLTEMESIRLPLKMGIERDIHFQPKLLSECIKENT
jgi:hypothetical protein